MNPLMLMLMLLPAMLPTQPNKTTVTAMHDIICPHCNKAFKVDETGYADILKQVRDADFHAQLHERLELAEQDKRNAVALAQAQVANERQKAAAAKDAQIQALKAQLDAGAVERDLAVAHALSAVEKQRDALANELERARQAQQAADQLAQARLARELHELKNDLNLVVVKKQLEEAAIKEQFALQLRDRDGEIARLRDMKARLSTKMVGETLEQHCETEFNRIRATAFPRAYFEKDNDARSGSKGDYIFRDADEAGNEIVSIMFEMKNESDETATKKRNEDFLKELDKDRTEKCCEYAVLVSLLEPESE